MYRLLIMFFATVPAVGGDPPRGRGVLFPRGKDTKGLPKGVDPLESPLHVLPVLRYHLVECWLRGGCGPVAKTLPSTFCQRGFLPAGLPAYLFSASNFFKNSTNASTPSLGMAL